MLKIRYNFIVFEHQMSFSSTAFRDQASTTLLHSCFLFFTTAQLGSLRCFQQVHGYITHARLYNIPLFPPRVISNHYICVRETSDRSSDFLSIKHATKTIRSRCPSVNRYSKHSCHLFKWKPWQISRDIANLMKFLNITEHRNIGTVTAAQRRARMH